MNETNEASDVAVAQETTVGTASDGREGSDGRAPCLFVEAASTAAAQKPRDTAGCRRAAPTVPPNRVCICIGIASIAPSANANASSYHGGAHLQQSVCLLAVPSLYSLSWHAQITSVTVCIEVMEGDMPASLFVK